ncbi:MAG: DNA-directed RNA polymerase subunit beta [marine benthic group bacterium]|nr:DNA-directed RNA polymerase subunit beta [Gemmatimonadota bacterium]MCL7975288.1 DNA-directed RNA polymerase subunit beta [Gemmatimonadota bacterium]MCL7977890.1 DNA-directed RNA polymerase subunit beta [Gemmatimonadota bacterium]MCL7978830.1 DNA-directed RNA polymerase subunit beta [Gemmatimonadota bacterium]MCL7981794.1 DNA-directed RNA polymerase subunit beta [Gemmatimonadota bacterium]
MNNDPVVSFAKLDTPMPMPHFLEVQLEAFERLLRTGPEAGQQDVGLERVFQEIFPITDVNENYSLEFVDYSIGEPKYSVEECMERDMTFAAPLKATLRLVVYEDLGEGEKRAADILEKEVYLGDLPLLTEQGTFVVNGAERVIVSQLHRSPGVVFEENTHPNGTRLFSARIIPFRGSWVEFTLDIHDVIHVHIDKRKKFPATALLRAFGYGTDADILELFYTVREVELEEIAEDRASRREIIGTMMARSVLDEESDAKTAKVSLKGFDPGATETPLWLAADVDDPETGEFLAQTGELLDDTLLRRFKAAGIESVDAFEAAEAFLARRSEEVTDELVDRLVRAGISRIEVFSSAAFIPVRGSYEDLVMRRDWSQNPTLAADVVDPKTGEVLAEKGESFDEKQFARLKEKKVRDALVFTGGPRGESPLIKNTLAKDPTHGEADALRSIYSLVRPGEAPNLETARTALDRLFFNPKRYDLGRVGRHKVNHRLREVYRMLDFGLPEADIAVLEPSDFVAIIRYLIELHEGRGYTDDIDHLGNRRVRSIGELIANQFSVGLSRMARLVRERMSINSDPDKMSIDDLVNARTVSAVIQAFFGSSQLSQFMDQTNPLAELTHKRRLSALGPGGLSRERAGFEVRDVHYSHYGRMCPIETPEGPNIGLITSMTTFSRLNELGFLETPYRKVVDGKVTDEIEWLSASEEEDYSVAQANAEIASDGSFVRDLVLSRRRDDYPLLPPDEIDFMDVAPDQLVAVSPSLIPFLEHDDANRALMGSNMQRQAVPLLFPKAPYAGTGLEEKAAQDSGSVVSARRAGTVTHVTAEEIVIDTGVSRAQDDTPLARLSQYDRYRLKKFWRTNQDTAINQRPIVEVGQKVSAGEVIADGASTDFGALALGRNVTVAFMPWYGHNFEDAIVISERLVRDDVFTSVHIQELELHVRDTKRGTEEITVEIPNVSEEALVDLDERGIVRIGAAVKTGDLLVGKITPKGETELSPEEKLLTAIFGEKAKDVKDSSLRVPPGVEGTVIDVKIFSRRIDDPLLEREHGERIGRLRDAEREEIARVVEARDVELREALEGQTVALFLRRGTIEPLLKEGKKLGKSVLSELDFGEVDLSTLKVKNEDASRRARRVIDEAKRRVERIRERTEEGIDRVFQADELSPGVVQLVKVYLAEKRKISVGDKMAGRHGNKGIIARVVPEEDMPVLPDGTAVDIVLNPLGVPSRMNVGQILETHLGWAARQLGFRAQTPVFQGATEDEIGALLKLGGALWAGRSLAPDVVAPEFDADTIQRFVAMVQAYEGEFEPKKNGHPGGLGRSLDAYLGGKSNKESKTFLSDIAAYLVEVARQSSGAEKAADLEKAGWPAVSELVGNKSLKSGLDAALVELMIQAGLKPGGKMRLRDGRSGEPFDADVTVGEIYMMKLSHLVDDKIHARSIGPYSLVTQQPLAGKAQFGGQRFGEMEVWALEAYGAAHTLQEMLTVKSDDVTGRSRAYEAIVKGENLPRPGVPESFNVLVKELQALGLSVDLGSDDDDSIFGN